MDLEDVFESEIDKRDIPTKNKLYVKIDNFGEKQYFFTNVNRKMAITKLKKDLSNIEEVKEKLEGWYNVGKTFDVGGDIALCHSVNELDNDSEEVETLPPNFYNIKYSDGIGYYFSEVKQSVGDKYLELGGTFKEIRETVDRFYKNEKVYRDLGMLHKMGCLLYGPPGGGKTTIIRELCKEFKKEAVVIFLEGELPTELIKQLRYFPNNYIFVLEEMTHTLEYHGGLAQMLNFLDGEYSLDQQLVLATTNYPEALPENLASRPSRFDKVIKVDNPDEETRRKYLTGMIDKDKIEEVVKNTKDMSIAYLKEIVISSKINNEDVMKTIKNNRQRIKTVKENFKPSSDKMMGLNRG